jgi:hypothetical protein
MDRDSPICPVLSVHETHLLPVSAKSFAICGELNFARGCFDDCAYIDSTGREWLIRGARVSGYKNPLHYVIPRQYRAVRVDFEFEMGRQYSLNELKSMIREFLMNKKLVGQPFADKCKDVPKYVERFTSIPQLISDIGYFDARSQ